MIELTLERRGAADDFGDFLRDRRLALAALASLLALAGTAPEVVASAIGDATSARLAALFGVDLEAYVAAEKVSDRAGDVTVFPAWSLEVIWCLDFGVWCFSPAFQPARRTTRSPGTQ